MGKKSMAGAALRQFVRDYGVPEQLTFDGAGEQVGSKTEFMKHVRAYGIDYHCIEPHRPQQNVGFDKWLSGMSPSDYGTMV